MSCCTAIIPKNQKNHIFQRVLIIPKKATSHWFFSELRSDNGFWLLTCNTGEDGGDRTTKNDKEETMVKALFVKSKWSQITLICEGETGPVSVCPQLLQANRNTCHLLSGCLFLLFSHLSLTVCCCCFLKKFCWVFLSQSFAIFVCHTDSGRMYSDVDVALMDGVWTPPSSPYCQCSCTWNTMYRWACWSWFLK